MVTIAWNPLGFHLLDTLPKGNTFNAEYCRVNLLTELFHSAHRLMREDPLFMLTTQDPTSPENAELFAEKIYSTSPYTQRNHMISHHPTSFSSDISNIICGESLFHCVRNYRMVQKSVRHPSISTDNLLARPNLLSNDAWSVFDLIAFLGPISSAR
jgi:hypothetical protein